MIFRAAATAGILAAVLALPKPARAFNQPGLNLGFTSLFDGGPTEQGLYWIEYVRFANAKRAVDQNGDTLAGSSQISAIVNLHQMYYRSNKKFLGGYIGANFVLPVVVVAAKGTIGGSPLTANTGGLGDLFIGASLHWDTQLLGRPYSHYVELDLGLPTGKFDPQFSANPGANLITINPYYSFTWMLSEKWQTSWQIYYAYHTEKTRTKIQPGQVAHFTYSFSRSVHPKLHMGLGGYFLQQLAEDKTNGASGSNTKERALSVGPALAYFGESAVVVLSHFIEVHARNRLKGHSTTAQFIHRF